MPTPQARIEALRIESVFSLPDAFRYKKPFCFCSGPLAPRRMSRATFHVRWHRIVKFVMLIQASRKGPSRAQKFVFVTGGSRISGRFCRWISCAYSTSLCPYSHCSPTTWAMFCRNGSIANSIIRWRIKPSTTSRYRWLMGLFSWCPWTSVRCNTSAHWTKLHILSCLTLGQKRRTSPTSFLTVRALSWHRWNRAPARRPLPDFTSCRLHLV